MKHDLKPVKLGGTTEGKREIIPWRRLYNLGNTIKTSQDAGTWLKTTRRRLCKSLEKLVEIKGSIDTGIL